MNKMTIELLKSAEEELINLKQFISCFDIKNDSINNIITIIENKIKYFDVEMIDIKLFQLYVNVRVEILKQNEIFDFKSPINKNCFKRNNTTPYDYQRAMKPKILDIEYKEMFFRSGMSAINAVLTTLSSFKFLKKSKFLFSSTYFESKNLVKYFYNTVFNIDFKIINEMWYDIIKNYDIIFFDIIDYSKLKKLINFEKFLSSLNCSNKEIIFLIIDDTIECLDFSISYIVNNIRNKKFVIFSVKSLIKLNQFGFEFFNLGNLEIYSNLEEKYIKIIYEKLELFRTFSGTSISHLEELILSNELFTSKNILNYKKNIYLNTDYFYENIKVNKLLNINFAKSNSPYILLKFGNRIDFNTYNKAIRNLNKILLKNKTFISNGTSFGFRHIRLEIVKTTTESFFRISPGIYRGLNFFIAIEFIKNFKIKE